MSLRFASQVAIDNLPDEQFTDQFEVIMPALDLNGNNQRSTIGQIFSSLSGMSYRPIVEEISFGLMNFTTDTRRIRTGWYNVPKDIENYHDVKLTLFCSANMLTQYYLDAWKALVFNKKGEYFYPGINYKKNIEVFMYGPGGTGVLGSLVPKLHFTLKGCFPVQQEDYKLEYTDSPQRFRIPVTFKVDAVVRDNQSATSAIVSELISSPSAVLGNALSTLSGSSEYSIEDTYGGNASTGNDGLLNTLKNKIKSLF